MLFQLKVLDQNACIFLFVLFSLIYILGFHVIVEKNSDTKLFLFLYLFYIYFSSKRVYSWRKNLVSTFSEKYLMSAPSRKSASFELAPPHEVPKFNERPRRSFDQLR